MKCLACALIAVAGIASSDAAELIVEANGFQSAEGQAVAALCSTSFAESDCPYGAREAIGSDTVTFRFADIAAGFYAVAVYHDIDGNNRMNTIPPGIPLEPYGFSNDVGRRGPPNLEQALIAVGEGRNTVRISVRRLFRQ